jgi:class 3 adenylate cyclase
MAWDYQRSHDRIQKHLNGLGAIDIRKLVREADLDQLLTETTCRQIYGAHVYVTVSNFARLASDGDGYYAQDDYKRLIQGVHIYQREVARIVEGAAIFDGLRVHFQGAKLHALFYRPIDDDEQLATRAALLQLVLKDFVRSVFNPAFPYYDDFSIAGGADLGEAIGTRNGTRGDRELLFLGSPANHAAKIIGDAGSLRLTQTLYDALPSDLQEICELIDENNDSLYRLCAISQTDLDALLEAHGIDWDREKCAERIAKDKRRFPLTEISYSSAETLIDVDSLSVYDNKRVTAASVFADVSGFTRYIDAAKTEEEQRTALRVFHAIRREMAKVITDDFDGIRIQYQGDRAQGLFHLPADDTDAIASTAVDAAVGLQSSMEHTLKEILSPDAESLQLAVGVDFGATLVSKLGTRGHRDRICLGKPVEKAALCEERSAGQQIGITKVVREALSVDLCERFVYSSTAQCYIATGLTVWQLEQVAKARRVYQPGAQVFLTPGASGMLISQKEAPNARSSIPSRSYGG